MVRYVALNGIESINKNQLTSIESSLNFKRRRMEMSQALQNVITAIDRVYQFISSNGQGLNFQGNYGLYINFTNKNITIHNNSNAMMQATQNRQQGTTPGGVTYLLPTQNNNDIWITGFSQFTDVVAFAYMFVDMMHRLFGEKWALGASPNNNIHINAQWRIF